MAEHDERSGHSFDPVLMAVLANRFDGIVREMSNTLLRTGRSAILNTARDFSCSIVTSANELLASAEGLPIHVVGSQFLAEAMSELHQDLRPGDAFLHNDPYHGNTHHADHSILVPVFFGGEHVLTTVAKAHQADCGNSQPTTYAIYAADIYHEGALNFPCVRIQRDYEDQDDLIRMCRRRLRVPEQWYGDYLAALGAARIGERRIGELLERYGLVTVREFFAAWLDYSEARTARALATLPACELEGSGAHDRVPGLDGPVELSVRVRVSPDEGRVSVDLRDNPDCVPVGLNESRACSYAAAVTGVLNQLEDDIPHNQGTLRRIDVLLREGSVAGCARHPVSCSAATTNIADRIINMVQSAFAQLGDGYGLAEGGVGQGPGFGVVAGEDPRAAGAPFINQVYLQAHGGPAGPRQDGWLFWCIPVVAGLMYRDSIEVAEQKYPILVEEVRLLPDSEGAGRHRGGFASRVAFGPIGEAGFSVAYSADGNEFPPKGVLGGHDGVPHEVAVVGDDGGRIPAPLVGQVELGPGQRILDIGSSGGGYGDPSTRDPHLVLADVREGWISAERAASVYAVAVTDPGGRLGAGIDWNATRQLREAGEA